MPKFRIRHLTKYSYEVPVRDSANQIMLYPLKDASQGVLQHDIRISGEPVVSVHHDAFGNEVGTFMHSEPHTRLIIDSKILVVTSPTQPPMDNTRAADQWQALEALRFQIPYIDFFRQENFESLVEIEKLVQQQKPDRTPFQVARFFCDYIFKNFTYQKGITTVESTLDEVWKLKSGVCQDFAHIFLAMLRLKKIPARYVSGYVCPKKNGMRGEGATHAWAEIYIPFYGWIGLDPTNNCIAGEAHVRLAVGKTFSDCSPVKGTYRGTSAHNLEVTVSVSYEDGQTTEESEHVIPEITPSEFSRNSYRRNMEMQMQQQQQQQ